MNMFYISQLALLSFQSIGSTSLQVQRSAVLFNLLAHSR
jgi:hypothetical protein